MFPYKVAFFIPQIGGGGAERVVSNLISQFVRNNVEVVLITKEIRHDEYEIPDGVKRFSICNDIESHVSLLRYYAHVKALRNICKSNKIEVLLSFNVPANYLAIISTCGIKTKHILSVRNDPDFLFPSKISKCLSRFFFSIADGAVFQTPDARSWFPKRLQNKSTIIYNPVNTQFYNRTYTPLPLRVVSCGRLTKQKNHEMLIEAFRNVVDNIEAATLLIFGEGNLHDHLEKKIESLGLEKNVFLKGRIEDVGVELSKASVFVLSSNVEGSPNALMEAMAIGVPSVSTDCPCGGPRMLLNNDGIGLLVPVNDSRRTAEAIIKLLTNTDLRNTLSKNARKEAEHFREDEVYILWLNYVSKICS